MLSSATLERVSSSYRRGYYAGYEGTGENNLPVEKAESGIPMKPFSDSDFAAGVKAGANDRKWSDYYAAKAGAR